MVVTILFALFFVACLPLSLSSDIKSPKDEIDDIRRLLQDQNERILKLESENLALKSRLSHVEADNAVLREQVMGVAEKQGLLQNEAVSLRRQLSEMEELPEQNNPQNLNLRKPQNNISPTASIENRKYSLILVIFVNTHT